MQETRYFDEEGHEQSMVEFFSEEHSANATERLYEKMNNRLFQLEQQGNELVQQKQITLSEKMAIERAKKAKKKINRMKKATA